MMRITSRSFLNSRILLSLCFASTALYAQDEPQVNDPVAFCAAEKDSEVIPDARTGGAFPESLSAAMMRQGLIADDLPPAMQKANRWRCMDGQVWVCMLGANLPCGEKADLSRSPSEAMVEYCKTNPGTPIPAYVTGRATVYSWECADTMPKILRQVSTPDAAGYLSEFWYQVDSPEK